jgi:predicted helicase
MVKSGEFAIEQILERYAATNDPNDWAVEHGNLRYILDLLLSGITVSVETVDIVKGLPEVKFE